MLAQQVGCTGKIIKIRPTPLFSACVDLYKLNRNEVSSFYSNENIDRFVPPQNLTFFNEFSVVVARCTMNRKMETSATPKGEGKMRLNFYFSE